jgi:hypothetical protein
MAILISDPWHDIKWLKAPSPRTKTYKCEAVNKEAHPYAELEKFEYVIENSV